MEEYLLYLDESLTHYNGYDKAFAVGGIIVRSNYLSELEENLNNLKRVVWGDLKDPTSVILHEKDLKSALHARVPIRLLNPSYKRFRLNKSKANFLYKQMDVLIRTSELKTIGCVVNKDLYDRRFPTDIGNEISLVCIQVIMENFTHFLYNNESIGGIIYESRYSQDNNMRTRFYQIAASGTMYVSPFSIQRHIKYMDFREKRENLAGLQIADFIPNSIARKMSGKKIHKNAASLTRNIFFKSYDGNEKNNRRYGIKAIPKL